MLAVVVDKDAVAIRVAEDPLGKLSDLPWPVRSHAWSSNRLTTLTIYRTTLTGTNDIAVVAEVGNGDILDVGVHSVVVHAAITWIYTSSCDSRTIIMSSF